MASPSEAGTRSSRSSRGHLLPPEQLASVAGAIELVSAMWAGADELEMSAGDERTVELLANYLQLGLDELATPRAHAIKDALGDAVVLALKVRVRSDETLAERRVRVNVEFRLRARGWRIWTTPQQAPPWLDRDALDRINAILAKACDDHDQDDEEDVVGRLLGAIEDVSEYLLTIPTSTSPATCKATQEVQRAQSVQAVQDVGALGSRHVQRTWYYLPSLSTRSKRDDICALAATSWPPLSGFLLAGKPGLIVLEYPLLDAEASADELVKASAAMDGFWSHIKRDSWSDIPSSHKKISQRLVQPSSPRAFADFQDVTDWPELQRAPDRGRKSDLSKLIPWLDQHGIQGKPTIEAVLGVGSWES